MALLEHRKDAMAIARLIAQEFQCSTEVRKYPLWNRFAVIAPHEKATILKSEAIRALLEEVAISEYDDHFDKLLEDDIDQEWQEHRAALERRYEVDELEEQRIFNLGDEPDDGNDDA